MPGLCVCVCSPFVLCSLSHSGAFPIAQYHNVCVMGAIIGPTVIECCHTIVCHLPYKSNGNFVYETRAQTTHTSNDSGQISHTNSRSHGHWQRSCKPKGLGNEYMCTRTSFHHEHPNRLDRFVSVAGLTLVEANVVCVQSVDDQSCLNSVRVVLVCTSSLDLNFALLRFDRRFMLVPLHLWKWTATEFAL